MKLSQELNDILNQQIIHELKNQNIYLQIASYFEDIQLKNLADYFRTQSEGEYDHAKKFIQHINDRTGGKVTIGDVESPSLQLNNIEDVANSYIQTEEGTTEAIEEIMALVLMNKSYIDMPFIQSMLDEQVEEEDSANSLGLKIKMTNDLVLFDATFETN